MTSLAGDYHIRVALIHIIAGATHAPNHGLTEIAALLIVNGIPRHAITTHVLDVKDLDAAPLSILANSPLFIFVSFMSNQLANVVSLTRKLKNDNNDAIIIAGGHHITAVNFEPRLIDIDLQVSGDVDEAFVKMLLMNKNKIFRGHSLQGVKLKSLDQLPLPQIDIFSEDLWNKYPSVIFSKGCPYACSYCMSRLGGSIGKVMWKSPQRAIEEIKQLVEYAAVEEIYIDDDTIMKNPKWLISFAHLYKEEVGIPFFCNTRPETVEPYLVKALKEAGCKAIGVGIESGSERIRRDILLRPIDNKQIYRSFAILKEEGILTWSFNMVGIPTESVKEFLETIDLNERCGVDYLRFSIFTEYPGMKKVQDSIKAFKQNPSYTRSLDSLEPDLQYHAKKWLRKLFSEDRLWHTESEIDQLIGFE